MNIKDVTVIGAGPVGMFATTYCLIRQMSVNLIESMPEYGGQPQSSYPQKFIYDLPMFEEITAEQVIEKLEKQIEFNRKDLLEVYFNEEVEQITKLEEHFEIKTNKNTYYSKTVLLTTGSGILTPRKIGLPNEDQVPNVLYNVKDLSIFKDKTVTILGGGDSALDWAVMINEGAACTNIIHRRNEYRAKEDSIARLNACSANQYMNYLVDSVEQVGDKTKLTIHEKDTNEIQTLEQDYILVNYGNVSKVSDFGGLDLEKNNFGYVTNNECQTSIEGIFACGNASYYEGKPRLISVGLGEVPVAVNAIKGYVDPSAKGKTFYSSIQGK